MKGTSKAYHQIPPPWRGQGVGIARRASDGLRVLIGGQKITDHTSHVIDEFQRS